MAQQESSTSSLTVRHRFSVSCSSSFLTQLGKVAGGSGVGEQEMDVIGMDHCYAKPWSSHPDASSARPVRMLFMPKQTRPSTLELLHRNADPPVDVVDAPPTPSMLFDISKARSLMTECERHASYARTENQEDWEDKISKSGWTVQQTRLFTKVMKILQSDRLARLAMESIGNEPIARRQVVDKTAKRMRQALASVGWDTEVVQWLHQLILDNLSVHLLACYLDALQTLKSKVPTLVEKMVNGAPPKHPSLSHESLGLLLKRPWDPVGTALTQQKLKKLPGNPLLLIAPSGPSQSGSSHTGQARRLKFWQVHLNSLGKTIPANMSGGSGISVVLCLEQMIGALRTKVLEQKSHHPGRPIILVGWNIGALVACHVSLIESVNAVVCLGFPFTGIHGPRGDCEDPLLGSQTPTLFVIGQNACDCSLDQLQDLREHMRGETGMLMVGGADEHLRLSHRQKREEGLTQAMADRCIIDEVYQFLGSILSMNAGLPDLPLAEVAQADLRKKRKRKAPQDLIGPGMVENGASPAAGLSPIVGRAPVLVSGSGRGSRRGGKASRLTAASAGSAVTAEGSRPGPRKRGGRGGLGGVGGPPGPRKRMGLGMGLAGLGHLGLHSTTRPPATSLHSTIPAATAAAATVSAISSAPELSGLLQGIRITRPSEGGESVVVGGTRSLMGTPLTASFPLTKVLTFSKLTEGGDAGNGGAVSGPATLLASAVRGGGDSDKDNKSGQQQFLVKTGGSTGSPLAIPISMAQRLMTGSSPLVHITGTGSSTSSQIHQLLTSIACSSSASSSSGTMPPHTALLINTSAASSSSLPLASLVAHREKADPGRAETSAEHVPGEKGDGQVTGRKNVEGQGVNVQPAGAASKNSDSVSTTVCGVTNPVTATAVSSLVSQKGQGSVSEVAHAATHPPGQESGGVVASLSSVPLLSSSLAGKVAMVKKASLTSPATLAQHMAMSKTTMLPQHASSFTTSVTFSSSPEIAKGRPPESSLVSQASPLIKPSFVQLSAAKSLINTVTSHSILRVTQAGSPSFASSILGGRNAVLISPAIARSLSSAPTAILLSKASSSPGGLSSSSSTTPTHTATTTAMMFKPAIEMLGKVSSVLEPGGAPKGRPPIQQPQPTQSSAATTAAAVGSASLVTVPVTLSKSGVLSKAGFISKADVISALKAGKPASSGVTHSPTPHPPLPPPPPPSSPVCVASPTAVSASPLTATVSSPTATSSVGGGGGGGGGRGGHKSGTVVSYAASSKPVLPTPTSTRTRKIKTPKQYDL